MAANYNESGATQTLDTELTAKPRKKRGPVNRGKKIAEGDHIDKSYPIKLSENILERARAVKTKNKVPVAVQLRDWILQGLTLEEAEPEERDWNLLTTGLGIDEDQKEQILEMTLGSKRDALVHLRQLVSDMLAGRLISAQEHETLDELRLSLLAQAPCGPFREAIDKGEDFYLSRQSANWLDAHTGDVVVISDGQSMEPTIPDGSLLVMRPLPESVRPRRGDITLVQVFEEDGNVSSTIKRLARTEPIELEDGNGQPVPLPTGTTRVQAVAVARAMMTQL